MEISSQVHRGNGRNFFHVQSPYMKNNRSAPLDKPRPAGFYKGRTINRYLISAGKPSLREVGFSTTALHLKEKAGLVKD
jgi:hypothetical protein